MSEFDLDEESLLDHIEEEYGYSIKSTTLPDTPATSFNNDLFSANTEEVLRVAAAMRSDPVSKITPRQILIAMLENEQCVATQWLLSQSVDISRAIDIIRNLPVIDFRDYSLPDGPRQRFEEVQAGISIGNGSSNNSTLSAVVLDRETQDPCILLFGNLVSQGQEIVQPYQDFGEMQDGVIGIVERIASMPATLAAIARISGERSFLSILPNRFPLAGVYDPEENSEVCKFGAETGYTSSRISAASQTISLPSVSGEYEIEGAFLIEDLQFAKPGDLGAMVICRDTYNAIGMVIGFVNSNTVCMPIQPILDHLNVELITKAMRYQLTTPLKDELEAHTDLIGGEDRLGFQSYVNAFVSLIADTKPPLTIGIYGAWGTGKSFLMDKVAKRLNPNREPEPDEDKENQPSLSERICEKLRAGNSQLEKLFELLILKWWTVPSVLKERYLIWKEAQEIKKTQDLVVWFDAWDYNVSEKLWAGLVERIFCILENELKWYEMVHFNFKRNMHRQLKHLKPKLLPYAIIVFTSIASFFILLVSDRQALASVVGLPTVLILGSSLFRAIIDLLQTKESQRIVEFFQQLTTVLN